MQNRNLKMNIIVPPHFHKWSGLHHPMVSLRHSPRQQRQASALPRQTYQSQGQATHVMSSRHSGTIAKKSSLFTKPMEGFISPFT